MAKGSLFLFIVLFVGSSFLGLNPASAQYNLDYGGTAGVSNYLGEIGGTKKLGKGTPSKPFVSDMRLDQTKFVIGGWIRYRVHPLVSAKASLSFIRIGANDSTSDYLNRRIRNLHFRNDIYELNVQGEYNFYSIHNLAPRGRTIIDFSAYAFVGGGVFFHNPKAKDSTGTWWALQPLATEGQGKVQALDKNGNLVDTKKYGRIQAEMSTGLGFHYTFKRKWRFGWEFGVRKTFTDYLDDVSTFYVDQSVLIDGTTEGDVAAALSNRTDFQEAADNGITTAGGPGGIRGNPDKNDWYMFTAASVGYVVRGKGSFYKAKYKMQTGTKRKKRKTRAKF